MNKQLRLILTAPWLGHGKALYGLQQYQKAVVSLQKALDPNPKLIGAWFGLGNALDDAGKPEQALTAYQPYNLRGTLLVKRRTSQTIAQCHTRSICQLKPMLSEPLVKLRSSERSSMNLSFEEAD